MHTFAVIAPKTAKLYHGTAEPAFTLENKPTWFAQDVQTAKRYGKHIHEFKVQRELKLLNIADLNFHNDFMAKVNTFFQKQGKHDDSKVATLLSLGLPDLNAQLKRTGKARFGTYPEDVKDDPEKRRMIELIDAFVPYLGGRHRYSLLSSDGMNYDAAMVDMMMKLYEGYDGYISEVYWPTYHLGGFHHPETCLFEPTASIAFQKTTEGGAGKRQRSKKKQQGGTGTTDIHAVLAEMGLTFEDVCFPNPRIFT